jgi:hypothetical protein
MYDLPLCRVTGAAPHNVRRALVVPAAERPGGFAEQRREVDRADTGHRSEDQHVPPSKTVSRGGFGLASAPVELLELTFGLP